jgi:hypothetical protein
MSRCWKSDVGTYTRNPDSRDWGAGLGKFDRQRETFVTESDDADFGGTGADLLREKVLCRCDC